MTVNFQDRFIPLYSDWLGWDDSDLFCLFLFINNILILQIFKSATVLYFSPFMNKVLLSLLCVILCVLADFSATNPLSTV